MTIKKLNTRNFQHAPGQVHVSGNESWEVFCRAVVVQGKGLFPKIPCGLNIASQVIQGLDGVC